MVVALGARKKPRLFRAEEAAAEAPVAEAEAPAEAEAEPETLPETGGVPFPVEGVLIGFGTLTAAAGVYLRRRKAA